jgi:ectoine hydroxylase-related dioxygenase (phytanoyl-CoA dioxygenase family)
MQRLHRDPMFVAADPPLNLCASWIALEDISDESGPLLYVPGSHRLPWFEFEPGSIVCKQNVPPGPRMAFAQWLDDELAKQGMEPQPLTCRRGDAFIWHGGLVHGGAEIQSPERTRKSFVVHYSTAANYTSRTARMEVRRNGEWHLVARTTNRVVERNGARGLDSPLRAPASPPKEPARSPRSNAVAQAKQVARRAKRWLKRHVGPKG